MSLYVRLFTGFWSHRKTAKLRMILGDDALWLVPRLWSYAAEHQPNGDFSAYSAAEIAMLVAYTKDAPSMLQALQDAGFLDGMQIHGWKEHNGFHETFGLRARKAAAVRWSKEKKSPQTPKEKKSTKTGTKKEILKARARGASMAQASPSIASSIFTEKKSRGSLADLSAFCIEKGLEQRDADYCFSHWEENGWTNSGKPIKDWKLTILSWKAGGYLPSTKTPNGNKPHRTEADRDRARTGLISTAGQNLKRLTS